MNFTRDFVTRENYGQIASLVIQKSLFTATRALFFISSIQTTYHQLHVEAYHNQILFVQFTDITAYIHYDDVIMSAIASQITSLTIVYPIVYSDADQRKHQSSASLAFVWGIHQGPVNSPHKWPVTRKMFPFDDVIMSWSCDINSFNASLYRFLLNYISTNRRICAWLYFQLLANKRIKRCFQLRQAISLHDRLCNTWKVLVFIWNNTEGK